MTHQLTICANLMQRDGVGRHGSSLAECLGNDIDYNIYKLLPCVYDDVKPEIIEKFKSPFDGFGKIAFWNFVISYNDSFPAIHKSITSPLKIAYSMFESSQIPQTWVFILNDYYDFVCVPDQWLVEVYKNSGVLIPIFVLPLGIKIENLLSRPLKTKANTPFTFGLSAGLWQRKNHIKVLEAFAKTFGGNKDFKLKLHGRFGGYKSEIEKAVKSYNLPNVEFISRPLSCEEYDEFIDSIDCYCFVSSGEGFSITPREILALERPCILSNNTAHKTICDSGFVYPIKADIKIPAIYEFLNNKQCGEFQDIDINDLCIAMKDIYENYDLYLDKAKGGREWVKQYLWSSLKPTYLNLFNPKNIQLSDSNIITSDMLTTSSKSLYNKLKRLFP